MKLIIVGLILFTGQLLHAQGQGISTSYVRMNPSTLPGVCRQGDLRVDNSSFSLQMCNGSNTWSAFGNVGGGGTGLNSATPHSVIVGNGTSPFTQVGPGTTGYLFTGAGASADPVFSQLNLATSPALTGTLPLTNGGTGQATAQASMNALAGAVTATQYLRGNGTNVVMSAIQTGDVPTLNQNTSGTAAGLSATLVAASGGTGVASPTAHGVLLAEGASAATSSVGGAGTIHQGAGASADPTWTATPTLGVNATTGGTLSLATSTGSGQSVTIQNLGTTTAYNFNLPTTPGSAGAVLTSQGGGSTSMTWGSALSNPMTTAGDLIIGGVSGAATRLAAGTASFVLQSNGAGNETWVAPAQHQSAYLTSGTSWTSPAGVTSSTIFKITLVGGGGGGGGSLGTFAATGGGGSGGMTVAFVSGLAASTGYTIAIGAGGSGGAATPAAGGTGGNTTISINSTTYTANGAAATPSSSGSGINFSSGGAGGTASSVNGTIFQAGDPGQPAVNLASTFPGAGNGGRSPLGGGGGVAGLAPAGGGAGTGGAGGGAGAGGGGSASGSASVGKVGGAGSNGAILIEWNQ